MKIYRDISELKCFIRILNSLIYLYCEQPQNNSKSVQ